MYKNDLSTKQNIRFQNRGTVCTGRTDTFFYFTTQDCFILTVADWSRRFRGMRKVRPTSLHTVDIYGLQKSYERGLFGTFWAISGQLVLTVMIRQSLVTNLHVST